MRPATARPRGADFSRYSGAWGSPICAARSPSVVSPWSPGGSRRRRQANNGRNEASVVPDRTEQENSLRLEEARKALETGRKLNRAVEAPSNPPALCGASLAADYKPQIQLYGPPVCLLHSWHEIRGSSRRPGRVRARKAQGTRGGRTACCRRSRIGGGEERRETIGPAPLRAWHPPMGGGRGGAPARKGRSRDCVAAP
ncbi:hypothetical protein AB1E18_010827 [Capra hircus]